MKTLRVFLTIVSLIALASCSAAKPGSSISIEGLTEVSETDSESEAETSQVSIRNFEKIDSGTQVEVFWAIPEISVEGFVIHYGYSPNSLDQEVFLWAEDLEVALENDRMVYKHFLEDIHPQRRIFISISAFNEEGITSKPSPVMEVR